MLPASVLTQYFSIPGFVVLIFIFLVLFFVILNISDFFSWLGRTFLRRNNRFSRNYFNREYNKWYAKNRFNM